MTKVWVNGTFDVMHIGHIKLLEYAHNYGLIRVGIDTDERVKQSKGESRPINKLEDRVEFIKSIRYVDSVVTFGSNEELEQKIMEWDANIMIIGDDYKYKEIVGSHLFERILFFEKIKNKSTSKILSYDKSIGDRRTV
jgi:D-beta-D-heptose 7-phosphate kinase/D-beta-D-heptose 1-phosphate adenosyltransferase